MNPNTKRKTVAIIGYGYVGEAMARFFKDHFDVLVYDPKIGTASNTKEQINAKADMAVVCVPTAMREDQSVDTSIVEETVEWLEVPLILIKSTIPPTTTKKLVEKTGKKIAFSPEYLGEGRYVTQWWKDAGYPHPTDMKYHDFQIFGGERETTSGILEFFKVILGAGCKFVQTDSTTAEIVKYMENSWGGTKVIFCNTFAKIAEAFGSDYNEVRELFLLDGRVERMHTAVFKDSPGFGGKCFPKDINGIVKASLDAGYEPKLLKSILEINNELRK